MYFYDVFISMCSPTLVFLTQSSCRPPQSPIHPSIHPLAPFILPSSSQPSSYLLAAERAASFIRHKLYDTKSKRLRRSFREVASEVWAFADDYAFFISGLLALFEASGDVAWLHWAMELQETQVGKEPSMKELQRMSFPSPLLLVSDVFPRCTSTIFIMLYYVALKALVFLSDSDPCAKPSVWLVLDVNLPS